MNIQFWKKAKVDEAPYWKISKRWGEAAIALLVAGGLSMLIKPVVCDFSGRARASGMIFSSEAAKQEITKALINGLPLNEVIKQLNIPQTNTDLSYSHISVEGQITLFSEALGTLIILTPTLQNTEVIWQCYGLPKKNMPATCRE